MAQETQDNFKTQLIVCICGLLLTISTFALDVGNKAYTLTVDELNSINIEPRQCSNPNIVSNAYIEKACEICEKKAHIKKAGEYEFIVACLGDNEKLVISANRGIEPFKRWAVLDIRISAPFFSEKLRFDI